jgi:DNA-binding MarR family transcriptional regulator
VEQYDEALRPLGLKVSQLNILVVTAKLGTARPAEVCDLLLLDSSTLNRNVERMQAHGWLEVVNDPDRRAQPFCITAVGQDLLKRAMPLWEQAQRRAAELLGPEGVRVEPDELDREAVAVMGGREPVAFFLGL